MANLEIHQFPCLSDNYGVLIHDASANVTASIDAPEASAVEAALAETGWTLTHILTTHHHGDHTGGNRALKTATGCTIVGPRKEAGRIPGIDVEVGEGDHVPFGAFEAQVLETPGHTAGEISYWFPEAGVVFTGDTLFSLGCGRLFEGSAEQMWQSLSKLMKLPPETAVYCGHEYTLSNAQFALTIEPGNAALQARAEEVRQLRDAGRATLPTTIGRELETNPFLRPASPEIQERLRMQGEAEWRIFGEIRRRKDQG
jgi:hydroxyacylglutathione hydrolase